MEQAEAEGYEEMMAAEEGGGSGALSIDLWTRSADAATTMELNGGGGAGDASDCSSDSLVVDVLKGQWGGDRGDSRALGGGGVREKNLKINEFFARKGAIFPKKNFLRWHQ